MLPSLRRVAVLANPVDPFTKSLLEQVHLAGQTGDVEIGPVAMVRESNELEAAFAAMASKQAQAVVVQAVFFANTIADLAIKYRLPSAAVLRSYPRAGGLMSYGANVPHLFRRSAALMHKILQGTNPAYLPVEQPPRFALVVTLKTAKACGVTVPESSLLRADEVVEWAPRSNAATSSRCSAAQPLRGRSQRARSSPRNSRSSACSYQARARPTANG